MWRRWCREGERVGLSVEATGGGSLEGCVVPHAREHEPQGAFIRLCARQGATLVRFFRAVILQGATTYRFFRVIYLARNYHLPNLLFSLHLKKNHVSILLPRLLRKRNHAPMRFSDEHPEKSLPPIHLRSLVAKQNHPPILSPSACPDKNQSLVLPFTPRLAHSHGALLPRLCPFALNPLPIPTCSWHHS